MKKLTLWLIILLSCQFALALTDNVNFVNALQYYELGNYTAAKQILETMTAPDTKDPEYALLRGKVHLAMGEYKQAYKWLSDYGTNSLGSEALAREDLLAMINEAGLYQELSPITVSLGKLKGNINSSDSEYAPVLTPDGKYMYFSSLRRSEFAKENIFLSMQSKGVWSNPVQIDELCTDRNESFASLSQDGNTAYLFGYYGKTNTNGDIYKSTLKGGRWSKPELIKEVSSEFYDLQPFVWRDKVMFFTSNRQGMNDNYDIYVSELKGGAWTTPVNLGSVVNTSYDEQSPFLTSDGKYLYFASFGHNSYGGNDIFVAERIGNSWTEWSTPKNLGPIINSVKDDRYYVISPDGQYAYLSSNRAGGMGQEDIYFLDLGLLQRLRDRIAELSKPKTQDQVVAQTPSEPAAVTPIVPKTFDQLIIRGVVVDDRNKPVQADMIWVYSQDDKTYMRIIPTDAMGGFSFVLPGNAKNISYEINTPGYKKTNGTVEFPPDKNDIFVNITCPTEGEPTMGRNLAINGKVLDENNKPVECNVRWSYVYGNELNEVIVETNKEGAFKLYIPLVTKLKYKIDEPQYAVREEIITLPENVDSYDTIIRLVKLGNDILLTGKVVDENDQPLVADLSWIYTRENQTVEYKVMSDVDGTYSITLPRLDKFEYRVSKANYMQISGELDIPAEQHDITKDFRLNKLVEEAVFELENVEFEFAKAILTPASLKILEPVLATMKSNESLEIELGGHTDNIGGKASNQKLSEARAKAVADYLVKNGIDAKRIKTVGYGFDKPIATNATPEGRQRNRRTELKILGIEYVTDTRDGVSKEFKEAEQQGRVVKTITKDTTYATTQTGIPAALEEQFKAMIQKNLAGVKQASLKIDLFLDKGKIQSANVRDQLGNLDDKTTQSIADMMLGWQVQSNARSIYSFTVKK